METFSIEEPDSYPKKRSSPHRIPWLACFSLLGVLLCMGASAAIIIVSDNQAVATWKVSPAVQLAIFAALSNVALGIAFSEAVVATWWSSAAGGASLKELHYIWDRGEGLSFLSALAAGPGARKVARTMLALIIIKVSTGPLWQRATRQGIEVMSGDTVQLNIVQRLPSGWTGRVLTDTSIRESSNGVRITTDWWNKATISTPGTYCDGTCEGIVPGAGISYNCSSTNTRTLNLRAANGSALFEINTTMSLNSTGAPFLLLTTLYTSEIDDNCTAKVTIDTCEIEAGIFEYPIVLRNSSVMLNADKLNDSTVRSTYTYSGDLPTAKEGAGAGALRGLNHFALYFDNTARWSALNTYSGGQIAKLFLQTDPSAYSSAILRRCALKWNSPTHFVLNSFHDYMFRAAMLAANSTHSQTFAVSKRTVVFHSVYGYLVAASAITLFAISFVLIRLEGAWSLRRAVSMSPLETTKAFGAPLMERGRGDIVTAGGILKDIGKVQVKYVDGVMEDNEESMNSAVEPLLAHPSI